MNPNKLFFYNYAIKSKLLADKRGTDKLLSIYWFVVLTLVAGGVFSMALLFYSSPLDVREIESDTLVQKLADCISRNGILNEDLFLDNQFDPELNNHFTKLCKITFNVEEEYEEQNIPQYFYKIEIYDVEEVESPLLILYDGNLNWESQCYIKKSKSKEYLKLAKCTERRFYAVDKDNNQYLIKVLGGVGKSEKNVK